MRERVRHDFRLLVDFLRHEMAVIALVGEERRARGLDRLAVDATALGVVDFDAAAADHRPVAILEIGNRVGERCERNRIGAEIHLALAVADRKRRALARADQQIVLAGENESEREGTAQARQRGAHRLDRRLAPLHLLGDEMRDNLGVGFRSELGAAPFKLFAQLAEIFDDAVMHDRETLGGVRMRVVLGGPAVRRPARVADAGGAGQRLATEPRLQIDQLAFGAPAREMAVLDRCDAGGIVTAIFQTLQRIQQLAGDGVAPEYSDNAAHGFLEPTPRLAAPTMRFKRDLTHRGNQNPFRHMSGHWVRAPGPVDRVFRASSCPPP